MEGEGRGETEEMTKKNQTNHIPPFFPPSPSQYAKIVNKLGFPAQFKDFKVQNMVGSADVGWPIRLEGVR